MRYLDRKLMGKYSPIFFLKEKNIFSYFFFVLGGFHLHLLVFPLVYQFNSRIGVLVNSSFANDCIVEKDFNNISASFQNMFVVDFT